MKKNTLIFIIFIILLAGGIAAAVSAVDAKMGESFISIYMTLPANPSELKYVEVLKQN